LGQIEPFDQYALRLLDHDPLDQQECRLGEET
jgi:hypothetical protein